MKALITLLGSLALLSACSPSANFSNSKDAQLKSLMDGETVEVVSDSDLDLILGSNDEGTSSLTNPNSGLEIQMQDDGRVIPNNMEQPRTSYSSNEGEVGKKPSDLDNGQSTVRIENNKEIKTEQDGKSNCRDRLVKQDKDKKFDEMVIAPKEIESNKEVGKVLGCGKNGEKKVLVCHFPNADYSKRKTLCIGRPALEAHLKHLGEKRDSDHNDYAGACQSDDQNELKKEIDEVKNDKNNNGGDKKDETLIIKEEKQIIDYGGALI